VTGGTAAPGGPAGPVPGDGVVCAECGFDWDGLAPPAIPAAIRALPARFAKPLSRFLPGEDGAALLRARPQPTVWSALEYAAHTRDAVDFYHRRIGRVLAEERPSLTAFDPDALCERRRYAEEAPADVLAGFEQVTAAAAGRLESLDPPAWERVGIGSSGDERTVLVLARRAVHEGRHHLLDIGRVLRHVREAGQP